MKKKSIFRQLFIPVMAIICTLAVVLPVVFTTSYEKDIYERNREISNLLAGEISMFMEGAYRMNGELADSPSLLTMETQVQTPVLEQCVKRNPYLDQLYIQGTDGMQTGRSSGELADRSARWWFVKMMEEREAFVSKSYYSVDSVSWIKLRNRLAAEWNTRFFFQASTWPVVRSGDSGTKQRRSPPRISKQPPVQTT